MMEPDLENTSQKWIVRDITGSLKDTECDTKQQAESWISHLWQWNPTARPVIVPPKEK
jgi:hypothetical protein